MEDDGSPPSTSFQPQQLEDHGHLVRQQADPEATKALDHQECYDNHELAGVGFDASRDNSRPSGVEAESPQVLPGRSTPFDSFPNDDVISQSLSLGRWDLRPLSSRLERAAKPTHSKPTVVKRKKPTKVDVSVAASLHGSDSDEEYFSTYHECTLIDADDQNAPPRETSTPEKGQDEQNSPPPDGARVAEGGLPQPPDPNPDSPRGSSSGDSSDSSTPLPVSPGGSDDPSSPDSSNSDDNMAHAPDIDAIAQALHNLQRRDGEGDIKVPVLEKVGASEWIEWRETFTRIADGKGWDDDMRKRVIIGKMRGPVVSAVQNINTAALTAQQVLQAYELKFVTEAGAALSRQKFRQAKQDREEELTSFHTRLIMLYRHAHPAADLERTQELIERFIFGLYDRRVQEYVFDHHPDTMTDALRFANIKMATLQAIAMANKGVHSMQPDTSVSSINMADIECYKCHEFGHMRRECPQGRGRGMSRPFRGRFVTPRRGGAPPRRGSRRPIRRRPFSRGPTPGRGGGIVANIGHPDEQNPDPPAQPDDQSEDPLNYTGRD